MPDQPMEERITEALVYHQRKNASGCICGWAELGKSHPAHQAAVVSGIIREEQAEAWDEGCHWGSLYDYTFRTDNPYRGEGA